MPNLIQSRWQWQRQVFFSGKGIGKPKREQHDDPYKEKGKDESIFDDDLADRFYHRFEYKSMDTKSFQMLVALFWQEWGRKQNLQE